MTKFERRMKSILEKQTKINGIDYQVVPPKIPPMNETIEERKKHFKEYAKKVNERLLKMKSGDSYIYLGFGKWIMNSTNNLIRVLKMNEGNLFCTCIDSTARKKSDAIELQKAGKTISEIKRANSKKEKMIKTKPNIKEDNDERTRKNIARDFPNAGR